MIFLDFLTGYFSVVLLVFYMYLNLCLILHPVSSVQMIDKLIFMTIVALESTPLPS